MIGAWFAILFTGRYPRGIFHYVEGVIRWYNRVAGTPSSWSPTAIRLSRSTSPSSRRRRPSGPPASGAR